MSKSLITLRQFGWLEGTSLLVLLFVAMPLRYLADIDAAVQYAGMAHGILFILFVAWIALAAFQNKWPIEKIAGAMVATVIPFAPFVADLVD